MAKERVRANRVVTYKLDTTVMDRLTKQGAGVPHTYIISDGTEYGIYQELGTSKFAARPFLVPAFNKVQFGVPPAIGRAIEAGINPYDILRKAAFDVEALAKAIITEKHIIDTGNLRDSIKAIPQ